MNLSPLKALLFTGALGCDQKKKTENKLEDPVSLWSKRKREIRKGTIRRVVVFLAEAVRVFVWSSSYGHMTCRRISGFPKKQKKTKKTQNASAINNCGRDIHTVRGDTGLSLHTCTTYLFNRRVIPVLG